MKQFVADDQLAQVMKTLYENNNIVAVDILRKSSSMGLPRDVRESLVVGYGMNFILPTLSIYLLRSHFKVGTLNTLSGDGVLYLSFIVSQLIQFLFNWCRSAASSKPNFCEFSKGVAKLFGPTLFATGAGYATGLLALPALGDEDTAKYVGLAGGVVAGSIIANTL
jgi:hypothetical protein